MAERRKAPNYEPVYERYQVPADWLPTLKDRCQRYGLQFMCSVYLPEDVPTVDAIADVVKVSSFEANDPLLLKALLKCQKPIVVSCGLQADVAMIDLAFAKKKPAVKRLHCVSAYPAKIDELGLEAIRDLKLDGFSDHSGDVRVGGWAVGYGAKILEVHLRLPETDNDNPDAGPHALMPNALQAYIQGVRDAEAAGQRALIAQAEAPMARYAVR